MREKKYYLLPALSLICAYLLIAPVSTLYAQKNEDQPIDSILTNVKDGLDSSWGIQNVKFKNGNLLFILYTDKVLTNQYLSMIKYICIGLKKYPDILKQINEISVFNNDRNQGWSFPDTGRIVWIANVGVRESDRYVLKKSKRFPHVKN